jgi:membrane protease YdiL (CAAX protease family)
MSSQPPASVGRTWWPPLAAVLVVVTLVVVTLVAGSVAGAAVVLSLLASRPTANFAVLVLLAAVIPTEAVYLAVSLAYAHLRDVSIPVRRPTRRDAVFAGVGSLVAVVAAMTIFVAADVAGVEPVTNTLDAPAAESRSALLLALVPLSLFVVAPAEEAFFRGVVQGRLRRAFGPVVSVLVASLLFTVVHVFNFVTFEQSLGIVVPLGAIFVAALVLGVTYERTANLAVPIVIHGAYNSTLAVVSYVSEAGVV